MHPQHDDRFVCRRCFSDVGIVAFIEHQAESKSCSFCGAKSKHAIAAPLTEVVQHIENCINGPYEDPANSMGYDSAEGGYLGTTYSTEELLTELIELELPHDNDNKLLDAICFGIETDIWCESDPYGLSPQQQLSFSWERFCETIKHKRRFFFLGEKRVDRELLDPGEVLEAIFDYAQKVELFVQLSAGTTLFRARHQPRGKNYGTATEIGPPPVERATQSNRMSPPGIVMMYASEDEKTALAETANKKGDYRVGIFVTDRDALILDLTRLPRIPSIFEEISDTMEYEPRVALPFLAEIAHNISRPIARDERIHVEYVPTQIVTEYLRTVTIVGGRKIDGVRYNSSRHNASTSLVLFVDQTNIILPEAERPRFYTEENRWVRLIKPKTRKIKTRHIHEWNPKPRKTSFRF